MSDSVHHTFESPEQLHAWLQANHASETELWERIFKKATGQPSVTWDDCVVAAIAWGWIDGLRNALDDTSFLQRLTPRRAQRWALGHRLRRQRHHGDARRLFGGAAARPRCPSFLRNAQTPEPVHHLPPVAQCQAGGDAGEAHGGDVCEAGAGRKSLRFVVGARDVQALAL